MRETMQDLFTKPFFLFVCFILSLSHAQAGNRSHYYQTCHSQLKQHAPLLKYQLCLMNLTIKIIHSFILSFVLSFSFWFSSWAVKSHTEKGHSSIFHHRFQILLGDPECTVRRNLSTRSWVCPTVFVQWDVPDTSLVEKQAEGILVRCPKHLNWLLSICRSNGTTLRPPRIVKLLILSQRVHCGETACTCDLILSVTTHSSWP